MMTYKRLWIVGTSHVSLASVRAAEALIRQVRPEVVALELDTSRYKALQSGQKPHFSLRSIRQFGFKGWLFGTLASFVEHSVGGTVGVPPGSEMLASARVAQECQLKIALIDQPLVVTLRRFSATLTWKEKWHFFVDLFRGPTLRKELGFSVQHVPSVATISRILFFLRTRYPNVYQTLIVERNRYMAQQLYVLLQHHSVVAVVGAGHEQDLVHEIQLIEEHLGVL